MYKDCEIIIISYILDICQILNTMDCIIKNILKNLAIIYFFVSDRLWLGSQMRNNRFGNSLSSVSVNNNINKMFIKPLELTVWYRKYLRKISYQQYVQFRTGSRIHYVQPMLCRSQSREGSQPERLKWENILILYCDKLWLQSTFYSLYTLLFSLSEACGAGTYSLAQIWAEKANLDINL